MMGNFSVNNFQENKARNIYVLVIEDAKESRDAVVNAHTNIGLNSQLTFIGMKEHLEKILTAGFNNYTTNPNNEDILINSSEAFLRGNSND